MKVALCLEEMGLPCVLRSVDTRKGEQHQIDYLAVNPNAKVPANVDQDSGAVVFDSNAVLLYLTEMTGQFLPPDDLITRGDLLSWGCVGVSTGLYVKGSGTGLDQSGSCAKVGSARAAAQSRTRGSRR